MLKSQDVLIALKLTSLHLQVARASEGRLPVKSVLPGKRLGWEADPLEVAQFEAERFPLTPETLLEWTYATLSKRVGLSASECNEAVKRGIKCGLLRAPRTGTRPLPAGKALVEFLLHGVKYVFPGEEGILTRGIPTGFAAPVLSNKLVSAGEHIHVWPDARGASMGLTLKPLHKAIPFAVRYDPLLYELAALVDAIRYGKLREAKIAANALSQALAGL